MSVEDGLEDTAIPPALPEPHLGRRLLWACAFQASEQLFATVMARFLCSDVCRKFGHLGAISNSIPQDHDSRHSLLSIHTERRDFSDELKMIDLVEGTIKFLSASPAVAAAVDVFLLVIGLWIVWALFVRH